MNDARICSTHFSLEFVKATKFGKLLVKIEERATFLAKDAILQLSLPKPSSKLKARGKRTKETHLRERN